MGPDLTAASEFVPVRHVGCAIATPKAKPLRSSPSKAVPMLANDDDRSGTAFKGLWFLQQLSPLVGSSDFDQAGAPLVAISVAPVWRSFMSASAISTTFVHIDHHAR